MLLPFHMTNPSRRKTLNIMAAIIPFYVFGVELIGMSTGVAVGGMKSYETCGLDSYYNLMNIHCVILGTITFSIILGVELIIWILFSIIKRINSWYIEAADLQASYRISAILV